MFASPPPPPKPSVAMAAPVAAPVTKKRKERKGRGITASSVTEDLSHENYMDTSEDEGEAGRGPLQGLVALQGFEGAWEWSAALQGLVGVEHGALARFGEGVAPKVAATVLAVHFLQTKLKDEKDGWELLVDKATAWLEAEVGAAKMAALFAAAAKII